MGVPVFVSYRHVDRALVRALQVELERRLPPGALLRDVREFGAGDDLPSVIATMIDRADTVLAVIGPAWRTPDPETGRPRLGGDDWVRHELALALARGRTVVPVLLDGADLPRRTDLPADLAPLADRIALRLRDEAWDEDVARLADAIVGRRAGPGPGQRDVTVVDAGPIAGGDITISGTNVAGRDLVLGEQPPSRRRRWWKR